MKRSRKNNRGQFVVVAALLIAVLTLSVALSIHQINLHMQEMRYVPVEQMVLGITGDLERSLAHALSIASEYYFNTGSGDYESKGYEFISKWVRSVIASYSQLGIKMNVNKTDMGLTDFSLHCGWGREKGVSQVYTRFDLDIDAYGFKGWVGHSTKSITLEIFPESITVSDQDTTLRFQIMQDEATPIPNLTPESLKIWAHITGKGYVPADVTVLTYLGGGNYTVTFRPRVNEHTKGVKLAVVTPEDGIYVFAYNYEDISVTLQSLEEKQDSENLGQIQLGENSYWLPQYSMKVDPAKYLLRYFAAEGYTFLNWTTSGFVTVGNPYSDTTIVTVDGGGNVTAFYRKLQPEKVCLGLYSRENENQTYNLGTITLGSTPYALPKNVSELSPGDYTLRFEPPDSSYVFQKWESTGGAIPWNPYDDSTTVTVTGNGTITAVYAGYGSPPPATKPTSVALQSLEVTLSSANLGKIQLGENLYDLPNSAIVSNGTYFLKYMSAEGYTFLNWTTTGDISVVDPYSYMTKVALNGNGTIIAFYRRYGSVQPSAVVISLNSRDWENSSFNLGSIILGANVYSLPKTLKGLASGNYFLQYAPHNISYVFLRWESTGGATPWEPYDGSTTVTVTGNATLTAVYAKRGSEPPVPKPASVTLRSLEETRASANLGRIQLGETVYALPSSAGVFNGTYFLEYTPAEGYTFVNWTTTGDISVVDPYSYMTKVAVNGDGTITAFYRGYKISLNSRDWENLSFNLGKITFSTAAYTLPHDLNGVPGGDYSLKYTPQNSSYTFLSWERSGGVIVWNSTREATTVTILGDGTITAVYLLNPPVPKPASVTLRSLEETQASANLGKIQLGETLFDLPNSATVLISTYLLKYMPAEGYAFLNWTTTGGVSVVNAYSYVTEVSVQGSGTITAFYRRYQPVQPPAVVISLNSRDWENSSFNLGNITLGADVYSLPKTLSGLSLGDYSLKYAPQNSSYVFEMWETTGDIMVWNSTRDTTTVTVNGNGTITAVYALYGSPPPATKPVSVALRSLEETEASANLGKIQLGETVYDLPNSATLFNGTYLLEYVPAEGYTFVNWTTTGDISVVDPYSYMTKVALNGDGTITAFYRYQPVQPSAVVISLYSRDWENSSFNLGSITLGANVYTLPNTLSGLSFSDYWLKYTPYNSSYVFLWWERSGDGVIVWNSTREATTVTILGNGTITAVYSFRPPVPKLASVTLQSLEETRASVNLGRIQLGETVYALPKSVTVLKGTYGLEYMPAEGYVFVSWSTTGDISVVEPYSSLTTVTVNGNGTITAFYRYQPVQPSAVVLTLNSRHWANLSFNLGSIALDTNVYSLPETLTGLALRDYWLKYTPYNSSYVFLWWETTGDVIPMDSTSDTTTLMVLGNGTLTAVYDIISGPQPPPPVGDWSTLYVDNYHKLMPPYLWSGKDGKLPPSFSIGKEKQVAVLYSPTAPTIYLARYVNVTAYIRPNPPESVKDINMTLGFIYNGKYYRLGCAIFLNPSQGVYYMTIDTLSGEFPEGYFGIIPEGSIIQLTVVVTFYREPWGTFFLYYGPDRPSRIDLF